MSDSTTAYDLKGEAHLDSRDIIAAAAALRADLADDPRELDTDEQALLDFDVSEGDGAEDWEFGAQLIRMEAFEDYAREFAEDIGAITDDAAWPCTCIDWERAARELAMDYDVVTFLGHDYYVR